MAELGLKIVDGSRNIKMEDRGRDFASILYRGEYEPGDCILLESDEKNIHLYLQIDEVLGESLIYLCENASFYVPFGDKKHPISPKAFDGDIHHIVVRKAEENAAHNYRNLALNRFDQHGVTGIYPHASANVETRGQSVFFAGNAIDGVLENRGHGRWPFASWGINRQDDAVLTIEFGRAVEVDKIGVLLRADFPHDNWWTQATVCFSDGSSEVLHFEKSRYLQEFPISKRVTTWVQFKDHVKCADDPSPFPALSQLEVYGRDA